MSAPILATKLFVPPPRAALVPRPHLTGLLNNCLGSGAAFRCKLTLVSAPAGFGKTTLISSWLAQTGLAAAWLSLDANDSELARFLAYLVAAVQTAVPTLGHHTLEMLSAPQVPATDALLTSLLNELAAIPEKIVLVLDDYHEVVEPAVDQALALLLDHLPPQLHLVITTREDPQLPLPRLRVRGQLTELRAADLRFTGEETAVFLNQIMGLNLTAAEVAALEQRTEGWVAGLQLAALSMQDRADVHGFIQAFAGDNRYVVDYLVAEVLQRQPPHVRQFLLQTSILERLCGDLCTAVTQQPSSGELLEVLERGNLFVVHLDDRRQWYRYHHLFADVLQAHIHKEQPEAVQTLHLRASRWYEAHNLLPDAVHHALAANDLDCLADLAERAWPAMDRNRESHIWLRWVKHLPEAMVHARPVLNACYTWAMLDRGELETAELRLQAVEQWLELAEKLPQPPNPYADEAQFAALPATVAAARTYLALARGDMPGTQKYARQALRLIPADDHHRRGTPGALLGLATLASGDLVEAYAAFSAAMASYQQAGNTLYAITGTFILADIRQAQGQLPEAFQIYERALQMAHEAGGAALRGTADLHLGLADLYREQNDLATANEHLQESETLNKQALLPRWRQRYCLVQARIHEAHGDLVEALALLDEAERLYVRGPVPDIRPIPALKARLWTRQGHLPPALAWAQQQNLSAEDALSYLREFDHLTLARLLIARGQLEQDERCLAEGHHLLARLLPAAEAGGRTGSAIEILIQQALAHEAQDNSTAAQATLSRALTLAEPAGYVRLFLDEGEPLLALLQKLQAAGQGPKRYVAQLLAAAGPHEKAALPAAASDPSLLEPLSDRELEVLQLVAEGLSNRQIAERLYLALSTVKGHNRLIYDKLNVKRRTEAVARARELGIL